MIDPNEIMLGNWIKYAIGGGELKVTPSNIKGIIENSVRFSPIPLTAEIMPKLGFEKHNGNSEYENYVTKRGFYISMAKKNYPYGFFDRAGHWYHGDNHTEVKSVHMLQNLHFILHGKHLDVSL